MSLQLTLPPFASARTSALAAPNDSATGTPVRTLTPVIGEPNMHHWIFDDEATAPPPGHPGMGAEVYRSVNRPVPWEPRPSPPPSPRAPRLQQRSCRSLHPDMGGLLCGLSTATLAFVGTWQALHVAGTGAAVSLGVGGVAAGIGGGLGLGLRWACRRWELRQTAIAQPAPVRSMRDLPIVGTEPAMPVANPHQRDNA